MAVQLQLLGLPRLLVDGRQVAVSWPRRSLALLTYLVTSQGAVPRDTAAFALWPDEEEESARANLRRNLNVLRGVLPADVAAWIFADAGSIEFRHADADTDVASFEASAAEPEGLRRAVSLYGGDFASPLDEPWVLGTRERLRARFHAVLTALAGIEFSARRFEDALLYARRIFADEPFREDVVRRIISIRYAMGDRPGALMEFERFARALRVEMNIEPMPETNGLRDLVLRGEPLPFAPDAAGPGLSPGAGGAAPLLPFAGRRVELERLEAAWRAASSGAGAIVLIQGEAGIGKTRIVAEFLERIVGPSARIFRGTTASPEARPYEALLRAFGQAAPFVASAPLEPAWLAPVAALVPEIGARCGALPPYVALPAEREVLRLFESFARFAIALARGRAVVVVVEDLHWSGSGTVDAIRFLAGRLRGHRILLIATFRTGERAPIEQLARDLCASGHAGAIALARLRAHEVLELLASAEPPVTDADAERLAHRSEGHPLFLTELVRDFPHTGNGVDGGIVELVGARLARCSADAQTLARIAAVCGASFDLDVLQHVAGWDDGSVIDRLAELLDRQFVRSTAIHERGSYTFGHALIQTAVLSTIAGDDRRRIHRIIARVLEAREPGARSAAEIARHWELAGEPQHAARAYLQAARESLAVRARDEAATLATAGLALTADPATRGALFRTRIEANLRRVSTAELRSDAALLEELARGLGDDARFEAALLAFRVEEIGGDIESRCAATDALRVFARGAVGGPLQLAQIAEADACNAKLRGSFAAALESAQEAQRQYARAGAARDELRLAILVANVLTRLGKLAPALDRLVAIEPRIAELDDPILAMDYWYGRTSVPHAQRDSSATLDAAQRLHALAVAAGDRLMEGHAALMSATAHQHASALTRTLRELRAAEEIYQSIGAAPALRVVRNNRASLLFQIGRIEEATVLLRALYDDSNASGERETLYFAASNLGCAELAAGKVEEAIALQREARGRWAARVSRRWRWATWERPKSPRAGFRPDCAISTRQRN